MKLETIQHKVNSMNLRALHIFWINEARPRMINLDPLVTSNFDAAFAAMDEARVKQLWVFIPEDLMSYPKN